MKEKNGEGKQIKEKKKIGGKKNWSEGVHHLYCRHQLSNRMKKVKEKNKKKKKWGVQESAHLSAVVINLPKEVL